MSVLIKKCVKTRIHILNDRFYLNIFPPSLTSKLQKYL